MNKLLAILIAAIFTTTTARSYDALYVIGDSLSMLNSGAPLPNQYYGQGSSNGPMWPEYLSGMLGFDCSPENDVATGSAATFSYADDDGSILPGVQDQIASLPAGDKGASVVVLWLDTNDVQYVLAGWPADETFNQAISNIQDGIETLYDFGFRTIIVPNVFNLTQTPAYRELYTPIERTEQRTLIRDFNSLLTSMIAVERQSHPDAKIKYVDVYAKWTYVLNHAGNYGLIYPFGTGMNDPDFIATEDFTIGNQYGSWDSLHPTTTIHQLLAQWFKAALP